MKAVLPVILIFSAFALSCSKPAPEPDPTPRSIEVSGVVTGEGKPLQGVVVSDGFQLVRTAADGSYSLTTENRCGYVFVSLPSGYTVSSCSGVLPQFYSYLSPSASMQKVDFELKKSDDGDFRLLVAADLHLANQLNAPLQFKQFCLPKMKTLASGGENPVYGLFLGDMTTDSKWYSSNYDLNNYLKEIEPLGIPVFHVIGNHDNDPYLVGDWLSASTYRNIIGPSYYSVNIGEWHFIVLDDIIYRNASGGQGSVSGISDYSTAFSPEVLNWLEKDLAVVDRGTPLCICAHSSLIHMAAADSKPVLDAIAGFENVIFLSGHHHHSEYKDLTENLEEHNIPSVTGVTWESFGKTGLHICHDGTPSSLRIYEFKGREVSWKQYAFDYADDFQFRVYDLNTIAQEYGGYPSSNRLLVNVFGYDTTWKVEAFQGETPLPVEKVGVKDPLYQMVYRMVYPDKTGGMYVPASVTHMFSVQATDATSAVTVKLTDRFGNMYSEEVARPKELKIE